VAGVAATVDTRDVPQNPRRGGRYHLAWERHADRALDRFSFNRLNVEAEQHFSWWRRQRLITVRGIAVLTDPDAGNDVPFYLQPTLGGSRLLRGFVTDRFRDRNLLAIQAEYGWDVWPFLNAVVFYESGVVAPDWRRLSVGEMKRDYGIGFRLGSARIVAVRTDVAFGSGEGARIAMRFSHAF
jgi:outer membrane protein assembly factor BamA